MRTGIADWRIIGQRQRGRAVFIENLPARILKTDDRDFRPNCVKIYGCGAQKFHPKSRSRIWPFILVTFRYIPDINPKNLLSTIH